MTRFIHKRSSKAGLSPGSLVHIGEKPKDGTRITVTDYDLERLEEKVSTSEDGLKEDIEEIRKMVTRTTTEIRRLSYSLHPTLLSDLGLEPALNLYFKDVKNHSDLDIDFHMVGFDHMLKLIMALARI